MKPGPSVLAHGSHPAQRDSPQEGPAAAPVMHLVCPGQPFSTEPGLGAAQAFSEKPRCLLLETRLSVGDPSWPMSSCGFYFCSVAGRSAVLGIKRGRARSLHASPVCRLPGASWRPERRDPISLPGAESALCPQDRFQLSQPPLVVGFPGPPLAPTVLLSRLRGLACAVWLPSAKEVQWKTGVCGKRVLCRRDPPPPVSSVRDSDSL